MLLSTYYGATWRAFVHVSKNAVSISVRGAGPSQMMRASGGATLVAASVLAITWLFQRRCLTRRRCGTPARPRESTGPGDGDEHPPPVVRAIVTPSTAAPSTRALLELVHTTSTQTATVLGRGVSGAFDAEAASFVAVRRFTSDMPPLLDNTVSDWLYDRRIVRVMEDATVMTVLREMRRELSSCALVYDLSGVLLGVLELLDLVRYELSFGARSCIEMDTVRRLLRVCTVAPPDIPLNELCQHLRAGVRYIAIETERGDSQHQIISQRALVEAIRNASAETPMLRAALARSVPSSLLADERPLLVARTTWHARRAFEMLAAHGVTSLPVVDESGKIAGVVSATDALHACTSDMLDCPVLDAVARSRRTAGIAREVSDVVSCLRGDSLELALERMLNERVHHVYVLTATRVPEGVVSFVDILRQL